MSDKNSLDNRIYKLSTGEKVDAHSIGKLIQESCYYLRYVLVTKDENANNIALLFPNKNLFENPDYHLSPEEGCFCPRNVDELGKCLKGCLKNVNDQISNESEKIKFTSIINKKLTENEGSPSENIIDKYKNLLQKLYKGNVPSDEEIYIIKND